MKTTSINFSSIIFILIGVIGLPLIVGMTKSNYYLYILLGFFLITLSLHYSLYYYILENENLTKVFPCRILNSKKEIKIKELSHIEIQRLYAPVSQIIFYQINANGDSTIIDRMAYNKKDLATMISFFKNQGVKIVINVRNTFIEDLKITRKNIE